MNVSPWASIVIVPGWFSSTVPMQAPNQPVPLRSSSPSILTTVSVRSPLVATVSGSASNGSVWFGIPFPSGMPGRYPRSTGTNAKSPRPLPGCELTGTAHGFASLVRQQILDAGNLDQAPKRRRRIADTERDTSLDGSVTGTQ